MNSVEQRLDEIEKKLDELKAEIKSNAKIEYHTETEDKPSVLRPNKDTPVNTVISYYRGNDITSNLFFFRKFVNESKVLITADPFIYDEDCITVGAEACTINIEEDLRFRLFLNAPEGYDWGAVDDDGIGYVYKEEPRLWDDDMWDYNGDCKTVGIFNQHKNIWKETLVRRKK